MFHSRQASFVIENVYKIPESLDLRVLSCQLMVLSCRYCVSTANRIHSSICNLYSMRFVGEPKQQVFLVRKRQTTGKVWTKNARQNIQTTFFSQNRLEMLAKLTALTSYKSLRRQYCSGSKSMRQRMREAGHREHSVVGDGNCQFRALSATLMGSEDEYDKVREQVVSWLRRNEAFDLGNGAKISDFALEGSWKQYCQYMSRSGGKSMICSHMLTSKLGEITLLWSPLRKTSRLIYISTQNSMVS